MKKFTPPIFIIVLIFFTSCNGQRIVSIAKARYEKINGDSNGFNSFKLGLQNGVFIVVYKGEIVQDSVVEFIGIDANQDKGLIQMRGDSNYYQLDCSFTSNSLLSVSEKDTVINSFSTKKKLIQFKNSSMELLYTPKNYILNTKLFSKYMCCPELEMLKQVQSFPDTIIYRHKNNDVTKWVIKELLLDSINADISLIFK
jgi:hypothetical protein